MVLSQAVKFVFAASKNEVEYEVMLLEMYLSKELSIKNLALRCDSQLMESQLQGGYGTKNGRMKQYLKLAQFLMAGFKSFTVAKVPIAENIMVDCKTQVN